MFWIPIKIKRIYLEFFNFQLRGINENEWDKQLNEMNEDLDYDDLLQTNEELKTRSTLGFQITEQNKLTCNTFIFTENI